MTACWTGLVCLGMKQPHVWSHFTKITGDITKGRNRSLYISLYHGVKMIFQGMENSDKNVNIIDTNAHLQEKGDRLMKDMVGEGLMRDEVGEGLM